MKTTAVILASLTLGLTAPAVAHAQFIDSVVQRAARGGAPERPQPQRPPPQPREPRSVTRNAQADQNRGKERNDDRAPQGKQQPPERPPARLVPIEQVKAQIQRQVPGEMLNASPPDPGSDKPVYVIRWQARSGQRIDFTVDARTGAIIARRGG